MSDGLTRHGRRPVPCLAVHGGRALVVASRDPSSRYNVALVNIGRMRMR